MNEKDKPIRDESGCRGDGGRGSDPAADGPKRNRRCRLPVQARLHLDDSLAANHHHPLADAAPETRAAGRLRLIAAILARLARGHLRPVE